MRVFTLRHELNCDESTYWSKIAFSDDFNQWLYLQKLMFAAYRPESSQDDGETLVRRVYIEPSIDQLPAPIQKLMGSRVGYTEDGVFDRRTRVYKFHSIPQAMADKVSIMGEQSCVNTGDGKLVRETQMRINVQVFGIGKMIEQRICDDSTGTLDASAALTNEYLKANSL